MAKSSFVSKYSGTKEMNKCIALQKYADLSQNGKQNTERIDLPCALVRLKIAATIATV